MKLELTTQEIMLAVVVAALGYILTFPTFLQWMNLQSPIIGFIIYELLLFGILLGLSKSGLVIFNIKIKILTQTIGLWFIQIAFFIPIDWESAYIQYVTTGSFIGESAIFLNSEDGVTWFIWSSLIPSTSPLMIEITRVLVYCFTPLVFMLIGGYLVSGKIKFGSF
jgi:hypothetical protein